MASTSFTHNDRTFLLEVENDAVDITNNRSKVKWRLTTSGGGSGYFYDTYVKATVNGAVVYNATVSWNQYSFPGCDGTTGWVVTDYIGHNSDGSKTISFTLEGYSYNYVVQYAPNGSLTLTPIARASVPTLNSSTVNLGDSVTINTNRASNAFTHTINIKDGNTTVETFTNVGASKSWTPSLNTYASRIPGNDKTFTVECVTYNGGTSIGTKTTTVKLVVPSSVKPSITNLALTRIDNGVPAAWGIYVQGKSKVQVDITASASQGSSLSGAVYNTTITGSVAKTGNPAISDPLSTAGTVTISSTVKDARGRTSSASTSTITVVAYSNPSISEVACERCDSSGNYDTDGIYLKYTFKASINAVGNNNAKAFKIRYKEKAGSTWTSVTVKDDAYSINSEGVILTSNNVNVEFDSSKSYDIEFQATDSFTTASIPKALTTGFDLIHFNESGKSIAFGKMSEASPTDAKMEIALDTIISNNFAVTGIANKFLHHQGNAPTDLNTARRHGTYRIGGTYTNAPSTSAIYGVLIVYVSLGTYWVPSDTSNWIWQELRYTSGEIFVREAVNNETFSAWKRVGVQTNTRNTSDTWIPVIKNGALDYTTRYMPTGKTHSQWETEQDRLVTLKFMSFWDGAYNSSHNSNLTYAHQGTIQCKPTSLYDNGTGTAGTVTLSQTAANFSVLEIYFRHKDYNCINCTRVWSPNGKIANLIVDWPFWDNGVGAGTQTVSKWMNISGTSMTVKDGRAHNVASSSVTWCGSDTSNLYITKVLGYKY